MSTNQPCTCMKINTTLTEKQRQNPKKQSNWFNPARLMLQGPAWAE